ncbi:MAG: cytochrome b/b6 domain-containing protein [Burkholderiales bacterium]
MQPSVKVWDPLVRLCHWSLVITVTLAWLTHEGWGAWHEWIGYASLAVVAVRLPWGFLGPVHARFLVFVKPPAETMAYAKRVATGNEERHLGHNPLGGWMIVALLTNVLLVGLSGWLFTTDRYWGVEWVEILHEGLAISLLVLIALHLAGVIFTSMRHRENLAAAMVHGRKRPLE